MVDAQTRAEVESVEEVALERGFDVVPTIGDVPADVVVVAAVVGDGGYDRHKFRRVPLANNEKGTKVDVSFLRAEKHRERKRD